MKINAENLLRLQEQIKIKDHAAFALGVALVEYEIEKLRLGELPAGMSHDERLTRLGAVLSEFDGCRNLHMKVVMRANAAQAAIGEAALAVLGLPEAGRNFIIDPITGEVLELVAGAYVPVQEAA